MATDNQSQLNEQDRAKLDGIVSRMVANKETDATIQFVVNDFKKKYSQPSVSPQKQKDQESAQATKATFPANTEDPNMVAESAKAVANIPQSGWNFVKGAVSFLNPVNIEKNIGSAITGFKEASRELGAGKTALEFVKNLPSGLYQAAVPQGVRDIVSAGVGGLQYAFAGGDKAKEAAALQKTGEALQSAQRNIVNDPVGQIAPVVLAARAAAEKAGVGEQFDKGVTKATSVVTKPVAFVGSKLKNAVSDTTRFGVSQATGLNPETITTIQETPQAFTKEARANTSRVGVAQEFENAYNQKNNALGVTEQTLTKEIGDALTQRSQSLSDTGKSYGPIRQSQTPVKVDPNYIDDTIKSATGLTLEDGKFKTSGSAQIRDAKDVRALQYLYDTWKPEFAKGYLTPNEFLNFRTDLAGLAKFDREVGKSAPIEGLTAKIRANFNQAYRPQVEGLSELDAKFSPEIQQLQELSKGLLDKEGNLTDSGLSRIVKATKEKPNLAKQLEKISPGIMDRIEAMNQLRALGKGIVDKEGNLTETGINKLVNATGKGKDLLMERLEEVSPGIGQKVKVLKAVEDIQAASGIKVGTYSRTAGLVGLGYWAGIVPGIITAILTSPEAAVPILRTYGALRNSAVVQAVMQSLRETGRVVNQSPQMMLPVNERALETAGSTSKTNFGR